jgi:hypothetical protein
MRQAQDFRKRRRPNQRDRSQLLQSESCVWSSAFHHPRLAIKALRSGTCLIALHVSTKCANAVVEIRFQHIACRIQLRPLLLLMPQFGFVRHSGGRRQRHPIRKGRRDPSRL